MKKPRIDKSEKEELMKHLFHMGYIKSTPGKWVLTMKGQQISSLFDELKKKGHVEDIDSRWLEKNGFQKFGEFLLSIISKK